MQEKCSQQLDTSKYTRLYNELFIIFSRRSELNEWCAVFFYSNAKVMFFFLSIKLELKTYLNCERKKVSVSNQYFKCSLFNLKAERLQILKRLFYAWMQCVIAEPALLLCYKL